jgi:hypothetical protein
MHKITNAQVRSLESAYKVLYQVIDKTKPKQANALRIINQIIRRTKQ